MAVVGAPSPNGSGANSSDLIETRGLSLGYNKIPVVRDLDLHVREGEVVCILGANGAGKTTTILGLAGELSPMSGEIHWLGKPVKSPLHVRARQGLAFVPEERSVIFGLSVLDNLRLGQGDVDAALELAPELRDMRHKRAGLLSGGEQQILTLARALASNPRLLIADELSLGLAPLVVERLLLAARRAADRGIGVLLVEQHIRSALAVADRALVLRRGQVVLQGTAAELSSRTAEIEASYMTAGPDEDETD
ncbi:MAG: ABC transporter ATP-binding protein [Acidimicrobiales bacterium]|nr:ABC transporter ATP-binding protein [Acidimicrobiales bacterium]